MSPLGAFFFRRLSQIHSQHESMFASKLDHAVRAKQLMLEGPAALKASWLTSWHSAFLTVSNLISQDICCWLCLEPDCLKFLKLSQLENLLRRDAESHFQGYEHFHWYIGFYPRGKGVPQGFKNATASWLHEDPTACNHSLCLHDSAVMSCQGYSTNEDPSRCLP